MNATIPLTLAPYIENELVHQNVCQLAFDQFRELALGISAIEKTVVIALVGIGILYAVILWKVRNIELLLRGRKPNEVSGITGIISSPTKEDDQQILHRDESSQRTQEGPPVLRP